MLRKGIRWTVAGSMVLALASLTSCGEEPAEFPAEFEFLTTSGAANIERHRLQSIAADQLNYTVSLEFPQRAIGGSEYAKLEKRGWTPCTGTKEQWDSYVDNVDKANPRCVYRLGKYFIQQTDLLLVSMQYRHALEEKWKCASKPKNSNQVVSVVLYRHKNLESMELDKLRLSCGK